MANKFLKEVKVDSIATAPSFVNTPINTQEIIQATTGNKLNDIVLDTAISYSKKLDKMKASNEIAKSEIALNNAIKEYELSWQKRDKYSDENYNEYKTGLAKIYDEAKANFSTTQYTTEADVLEWENKINQSQANALYTQDGERANYDIKKTTDETLTNVSGLLAEYSATGDESLKLKALDMMNRLEDIGIPKGEIEQKKIKLLVKADSDKLEIDINKIINDPNLSLEDKKNQIKLMRDNLSSQNMFKLYTDESIKNKYLDQNSADTLMSYSKAIYQDKFLKAGGILDGLIQQIQAKNDRLEAKRIKAENDYLKEQNKELENFYKNKTGRDIPKGLSALIGQEVNGEYLIEDPAILYQYTNFTKEDYINYEKSDKYVPMINTSGVNDINDRLTRNEDKTTLGQRKFNELDAIINTFDPEDDDYNRYVKYTKMQLIDEGIVSQGDIAIYDKFKGEIVNGRDMAQEYMNMYNRADRVSFDINTVNPNSADYKTFKGLFGDTNNNTIDITLNIIQGKIANGDYANGDEAIYSDVVINKLSLNNILSNKQVQRDIRNISGKLGKTNYRASSPTVIKISNTAGEEMIKSRLKYKHQID